jgi:membrane protease YdiL (CAAX protease family)
MHENREIPSTRLCLADVGVAPTRRSMIRLIVGFSLGIVLVVLRTSFVSLAGHVQWVRTSEADFAPAGLALLAYLLLAAREELAFRGYPLRRLESSFGMWTAQFVVALGFALEHVAGGYTWTSALLGAAVGSLLFGMAALATRGLTVPIGLHAAWNFGQCVLGEKEISGLWKPVVEQGYRSYVDDMGRIGYLLAFGSTTVAFWLFDRYRRREQRKPVDVKDRSLIAKT